MKLTVHDLISLNSLKAAFKKKVSSTVKCFSNINLGLVSLPRKTRNKTASIPRTVFLYSQIQNFQTAVARQVSTCSLSNGNGTSLPNL